MYKERIPNILRSMMPETTQVSLASVMQVGVMLAAVGSSFMYTQFQTAANADENTRSAVRVEAVDRAVREMEVREAAQTERMKAIQTDLRGLHQGQERLERVILEFIQREKDQ